MILSNTEKKCSELLSDSNKYYSTPELKAKVDDTYKFQVVEKMKNIKEIAKVVIANRYDSLLDEIEDKVYTRDIFMKD